MPISLSMLNNSYIKNSGFQVTEPVSESVKDIFNKAPRIQLVKFKGIEGAMVILRVNVSVLNLKEKTGKFGGTILLN